MNTEINHAALSSTPLTLTAKQFEHLFNLVLKRDATPAIYRMALVAPQMVIDAYRQWFVQALAETWLNQDEASAIGKVIAHVDTLTVVNLPSHLHELELLHADITKVRADALWQSISADRNSVNTAGSYDNFQSSIREQSLTFVNPLLEFVNLMENIVTKLKL